VHLEFL